ncbi:MAG: outer membrane lipid asymmetry maintenance protein MlaD [Burkholderiaceae bacterium]|uniref:Outer membrane lipid asymmetry maintenance protein MlaD n=1 Tax=Rubrivivax albus TaxID=2499835 RepID=A0A3S2WWL1_9BURK|nr:outer membrane lipid asymmetry maintenance protein MlaD [Rubrivivax albus]MCP5271913.1 outer membrane lipid asymmetry maintenance protein MlaD [Burkholderiaceae bacterium]RVT53482.1 outer membrane lipid asymmetry maintenance protein MlaD [Rubrivivax albus]
MGRKGIETLVGFFVLLGLLALVFLAFRAANLGNFNGGATYTVTAKFQNIGGLKPRAPVRSAGVKVGSVTSIGLDPVTYEGVVTMKLQQDFKFPKDTAAKILTSGLLGDQYIGLEPGPAEEMVADGGRFSQTQSAVVLENLIGQFLANSAEKAGSGQ